MDATREIQALKEPDETYDDLLRDLVQRRRREELEDRFQELEETDSDELTSLDDT